MLVGERDCVHFFDHGLYEILHINSPRARELGGGVLVFL